MKKFFILIVLFLVVFGCNKKPINYGIGFNSGFDMSWEGKENNTLLQGYYLYFVLDTNYVKVDSIWIPKQLDNDYNFHVTTINNYYYSLKSKTSNNLSMRTKWIRLIDE